MFAVLYAKIVLKANKNKKSEEKKNESEGYFISFILAFFILFDFFF